jgi:hypothetical protein
VEKASDMIGMIPHAKPLSQHRRDPLGRPHGSAETIRFGASCKQMGKLIALSDGQFGRTPRTQPPIQPLRPLATVRLPPLPDRLSADPYVGGDLRQAFAPSQRFHGMEAARFPSDFIATSAESGGIHAHSITLIPRLSTYLCRGL